MFGIGSTELLVILVVALIVLGPKSLASVSRSLGKAMGEFRRVSTDFQRTLNAESAEADLREKAAEQRRKAAAEAGASTTPPPSHDGAAGPATAGAAAPTDAPDEDEHSLTAPEGSPLAEALAKARAEAEGAAAAGNAAHDAAASAPGMSAPTSSTPPADGPGA